MKLIAPIAIATVAVTGYAVYRSTPAVQRAVRANAPKVIDFLRSDTVLRRLPFPFSEIALNLANRAYQAVERRYGHLQAV